MLKKIKMKLLSSKYIIEMIGSSPPMRHGFKRNCVLSVGIINILLQHKFNLWDYMDSVEKTLDGGYIFTFTQCGTPIHMYLPRYWEDYIPKCIALSGDFYERSILDYLGENFIQEGSTILDLGANIGNHTVYFGKICKAKKIYSFEPIPSTFIKLQRNVQLNHLEDIAVIQNVAVGSQSGKGKVKLFDPQNTGITQVETSIEGDLQFVKLDDFTFDTIDFVKIDVEGFEYDLLLGAENTLKKHSPTIFLEIFEEHREKVDKLLSSYGYHKVEEFEEGNFLYKKHNQSFHLC